jgi:CheY-like chemotaxis protein
MPMATPRVLLVEDDASLRSFVAMALQDMDIELVQCAAVARALELLSQGSYCLILTGLMMPGESGFDLLAHLQRAPRLRGAAQVAVLSAGLSGAVREQLAGFDVWRLLSKPNAASVLVACVNDAIAGAHAGALPDTPATARPGPGGDSAYALHEYFEGNQELFDAYSSACMDQFPHDARDGDAASTAADLQALRRVAHSLNSVLLALGYAQLSAQARTLEDSSHSGMLELARGQWASLRAALLQLLQDAGT